MDPVSPDLLEQLVFAKPYFDYAGLILAFQDGSPVGFAHAGFGPNEQLNAISFDLGVTSIVIVRPDCAEGEVAAGLLEQCERYLRARGAKVLYGGAFSRLILFIWDCTGAASCPGCWTPIWWPEIYSSRMIIRKSNAQNRASRSKPFRSGDRPFANANPPANAGGRDD